jgi:hypothetical protein
MSGNVVIWGTSIAPASSSLRWRTDSDGNIRITSEGDIRNAYIAPSQIVNNRVDSDGNLRVDSDGDQRVTIDGLQGPQYYQSDTVTADGGEPFEFSHTDNPWQPDSQGGENIFRWAFVTVSWSMAAQMQISPIVDGQVEDITLPNGDVLSLVLSTFSLPQQDGSLQRQVQVFPVPLVRRVLRNGVEISRFYLRGERLQLIVESVGALGVGELMVDGIQVDVEPLRKAIYPAGALAVASP